MFPWSFSWLPKLPSLDFSLSSGIEKRFVAFALRQALGHLLKPGQLDVQQVDSQIGSGYVQIRDLELDDEAVNALISGLPIRLRDGSVGKVTARIPWPNPLTSFGGVSLESLHLTFYLEPTLASPSEQPFADNLAESVASIAETFIHEELTARKATLRDPLRPDLSGSESSVFQDNIPGGLDPFISEDEVHQHDADPPGLSMMMTFIERLVARFRFDATDTRITIVNPQQASFTLIIPEIRCAAEPQGASPIARDGVTEESSLLGDVWKLTITGPTVTTRCLRPISPTSLVPSCRNPPSTPSPGPSSPRTPSPTTSSPAASASLRLSVHEDPVNTSTLSYTLHETPPSPELSSPLVEPSSPYSDSSDMDEETQMFMSQSIALLPPRPVSPASSVASSMYQSAISTVTPEPTLDNIPEEECPPSPSTPPLSPPTEAPEEPVAPREPVPESSPELTPEPIASSSPHTGVLPPLAPISGEDQCPASQFPVSPFRRRFENRRGEIEDETVLSLGSQPIEILLSTHSSYLPTPSAGSSTQSQDSRSADEAGSKNTTGRRDRMRIDLSMGTIACAFSARQIRSIIDIAEIWSSHCPPLSRPAPPSSDGDPTSPFPFYIVDGSLRIRGIVVLLLPSQRSSASSPDDVLTEYFARPVVPPPLLDGYTRIHIDGVEGSLAIRRVFKDTRMLAQQDVPSTSASLTVSDISVFAFLRGKGANADITASPVLITDPHLPTQYPPAHFHPSLDASLGPSSLLPTFDVVDWSDPGQRTTAAKLSPWRTKPLPSGRVSSSPAWNGIQRSPSSTESPLRQGADSSSPSSRRPVPVTLPSSLGRIGLTGLSASPGKGSQSTVKISHPALAAKFRSASGRPKDRHGGEGAADLQVNLAPFHVFLDIGAALSPTADGKNETLRFVDELIGRGTPTPTPGSGADAREDEEEYGEEAEAEGSRPGTPRASGAQILREREAERERRRLERLVLEDLDLGYDYRQPEAHPQTTGTSRVRRPKKRRSKAPGIDVTVNLPAIRAEVRVPPPLQRPPRSGAVILDIHGLCLSPGRAPERGGGSTARFGTAEDLYGAGPVGHGSRDDDNILLGATWKRIVVAHSLVGENRARAILSLGPLTTQESQSAYFGAGTSPAHDIPSHNLQPQLILSRANASSAGLGTVTSTAVSLDIPSVHVELSKPLIDGLQLWADDITQLMEAAFAEPAPSEAGTERAGSVASSMIGSRYFARSSTMGSAPDSGVTSLAATMRVRQEPRSETAIKVMVTEAAVRLLVPRDEAGRGVVRPFDLAASDVDVLLELKPEGKDETVVTVGVMDLNVHDLSPTGRNCFLSLTTPRSLNTTIKSALKLRFTSLVVPETTAKESRIRLTLCGVTYHFYPDLKWAADLARFFKAPPGAFESVVPSERTRVNVKVVDTSIRLLAPSHPGAVVPYIGELDFSTVIEGNSPTTSLNLSIPALALLLIDDLASTAEDTDAPSRSQGAMHGVAFWKLSGYALLVEVSDLILAFKKIDSISPPDIRLLIEQGDIRLHMCADTMGALGAFIGDFSSAFKSPTPETPPEVKRRNEPANVSETPTPTRSLLSSLDDHAFRRLPEVGAAPDMIEDDLPTNPDYLDESFGAAAGLRELSDDEFDESDVIEAPYTPSGAEDPRGITSSFGGETIRLLRPDSINVVENYFETLPPDPGDSNYGDTTMRVRVHNFNATVFLYDGYDWIRTRKIIEEKAKEMRRKLAKIRQLVASGQTPDPSVEETNALLFNSVYIGLEHNVDELEPGALIAAIDEELNEDFETTTQSSWQSLKPQPLASPGRSGSQSTKTPRRRLRRAKGPSLEIRLLGLDAEVDNYRDDTSLVSRILATVKDAEILDHIKTSTWKKFLTSLQTDSRGNVRESDSNMVRVELRTLHPVPGHPSEEARLRAKILPLRLHVDQDAVDFLKQFFSFKDPDAAPSSPSEPSNEIYFQQAEVFPIDIKLDYKPRRVDYRALKEGRTIELMNFFHFDGAEMTLRHITLNGITGWPRFFDLLNDLWTPDVKATQLVEVISGVAPIRSVVNVGSGVADLVLLPIAQYKKDGRVVRGLQKGANAFIKSTGMEAIRLGARLATGTQVILEQAETVLGGQFKDQVTAEALQIPVSTEIDEEDLDEDAKDLISKYADQPTNVKEGMKSAYNSLKKNLNSAAQTILAVPMEVYERSGNEGPVRAVVRAVPIAVLKPMIGASEAVSKTLLGLQNTLDPNIRQENEAKYKQR